MDLEVLKTSRRWLADGERLVLATMVRTWGSSPRPTGAMAAIRCDGLLIGSVSGGCIEDDLIERARRDQIDLSRPSVARYGVAADEAHRFGLPCGGTLELVLEPLTQASGIDAEPGRAGLAHARHEHGRRAACAGRRRGWRSIRRRKVGSDPREEYTTEWRVPGAELVRTMPDDAVVQMSPDGRSAIIARTHDPKLDDLALIEALRTPAFYVGALGSRRNDAARRERLREFDLSDADLARLHGPIGIDIGSRTPAEIAISIPAELTAAKNGVPLPTTRQVKGAMAVRERADCEA